MNLNELTKIARSILTEAQTPQQPAKPAEPAKPASVPKKGPWQFDSEDKVPSSYIWIQVDPGKLGTSGTEPTVEKVKGAGINVGYAKSQFGKVAIATNTPRNTISQALEKLGYDEGEASGIAGGREDTSAQGEIKKDEYKRAETGGLSNPRLDARQKLNNLGVTSPTSDGAQSGKPYPMKGDFMEVPGKPAPEKVDHGGGSNDPSEFEFHVNGPEAIDALHQAGIHVKSYGDAPDGANTFLRVDAQDMDKVKDWMTKHGFDQNEVEQFHAAHEQKHGADNSGVADAPAGSEQHVKDLTTAVKELVNHIKGQADKSGLDVAKDNLVDQIKGKDGKSAEQKTGADDGSSASDSDDTGDMSYDLHNKLVDKFKDIDDDKLTDEDSQAFEEHDEAMGELDFIRNNMKSSGRSFDDLDEDELNHIEDLKDRASDARDHLEKRYAKLSKSKMKTAKTVSSDAVDIKDDPAISQERLEKVEDRFIEWRYHMHPKDVDKLDDFSAELQKYLELQEKAREEGYNLSDSEKTELQKSKKWLDKTEKYLNNVADSFDEHSQYKPAKVDFDMSTPLGRQQARLTRKHNFHSDEEGGRHSDQSAGQAAFDLMQLQLDNNIPITDKKAAESAKKEIDRRLATYDYPKDVKNKLETMRNRIDNSNNESGSSETQDLASAAKETVADIKRSKTDQSSDGKNGKKPILVKGGAESKHYGKVAGEILGGKTKFVGHPEFGGDRDKHAKFEEMFGGNEDWDEVRRDSTVDEEGNEAEMVHKKHPTLPIIAHYVDNSPAQSNDVEYSYDPEALKAATDNPEFKNKRKLASLQKQFDSASRMEKGSYASDILLHAAKNGLKITDPEVIKHAQADTGGRLAEIEYGDDGGSGYTPGEIKELRAIQSHMEKEGLWDQDFDYAKHGANKSAKRQEMHAAAAKAYKDRGGKHSSDEEFDFNRTKRELDYFNRSLKNSKTQSDKDHFGGIVKELEKRFAKAQKKLGNSGQKDKVSQSASRSEAASSTQPEKKNKVDKDGRPGHRDGNFTSKRKRSTYDFETKLSDYSKKKGGLTPLEQKLWDEHQQLIDAIEDREKDVGTDADRTQRYRDKIAKIQNHFKAKFGSGVKSESRGWDPGDYLVI